MATIALGTSPGCNALPDVAYTTERFQIATSFDMPVCQGTLDAIDAQADHVERTLSRPPVLDPLMLYWLDDVGGHCTGSETGCFYPGTRILFSTQHSINHEVTHAVLDVPRDDHVFVEEGLAEMLTGNGVVFRLDQDPRTLRDKLGMDRADARDGELSYPGAFHFWNWATREVGISAAAQLARDLNDAAGPGRVRESLESVFELPLDEIDALYRASASRHLRGDRRHTYPSVVLDDLTRGYTVDLDCEDAQTRGPRPDLERGMYRVVRLDLPRGAVVEFELESDGAAGGTGWVDLFDPYASVGRRRTLDWSNPDPAIDADAQRIVPGRPVRLPLHAGTYVLMFARGDIRNTSMTMWARGPFAPVP